MAPFFFWPILFVTLPVLVWLLDATPAAQLPHQLSTPDATSVARQRPVARRKPAIPQAAKDGWSFGFGYFFFGLFWIGEAFLVEAETFGFLLPFAVTLMPAGLAVFWAIATGVARWFWRPGLHRVFILALTLSAAEFARGHLFTGFPWNTLGYALTWPLSFMQSASVIGIYGLTLLTVIIFAGPLVGLAAPRGLRIAPRNNRNQNRFSLTGPGRVGLAMACLPLLMIYGFGTARLAGYEPTYVEGVKLRVVQPATRQRDKWRAEKQSEIFQTHLDLSRVNQAGAFDNLEGVTHVVWPEAAMPFLPLSTPQALSAIGEMLPPDTYLISGALRVTQAAAPNADIYTSAPGTRRVYNSLMVFGPTGGLVSLYDKLHLVPFGEYLPFQRELEAIGLQSLTRVRGGFSTGVSPRPTLQIPGLPAFVPLICYEAIFPTQAIQDPGVINGTRKPGLLINVTNDGWFGNMTGPPQHFHQNRIRAVEEGLPLVRAANNGISAVVGPHGHIKKILHLNEKGAIDAMLPSRLNNTVYAQFGDIPFLAIWLCIMILIGVTRLGRG
ncbi:MAG: apolipoprotein N-acyltransferase [Pseudomonadota bacterium]